jgi:hypothetical protein
MSFRGLLNRNALSELRADADLVFLLGFSTRDAPLRGLHVDLAVKNDRDEIVVHTRSPFVCDGLDVGPHQEFDVRYTIRSPKLAPGKYFLTVYVVDVSARVLLWVDNIDACVVGARSYFGRVEILAGLRAPIVPEYSIALESVRSGEVERARSDSEEPTTPSQRVPR